MKNRYLRVVPDAGSFAGIVFWLPKRNSAAWLKLPVVLLLAILLCRQSAVFAQISISFEMVEPSCAGYQNGTIQAIPSGGVAPYVYQWNNNQGGQTLFGLQAGHYSVTVTDATGETASAPTTLGQPGPLSANILSSAGICAGNQASFTALVSGGTSPFSYHWSNGATSQTIANPDPGYYFITVTDDNGCQTVGSLNIPAPLSATVHVIDVICPGTCDGSAEAIISGGVAPYSFQWNTGATTQVIFPLPPGTYTYTVTDGNGCTSIASGVVTEPPSLLVDVTVDDPCGGSASAIAQATGGTPPYTYQWSNGATGASVTNLTQGVYFVTVTDANDCKEDQQITISNGVLVVIVNATDVACAGSATGTAEAGVPSGIGPFTYLWSGGQTTQAVDNLPPGTHLVTVTDGAGCTGSASTTIGQSAGIAVGASSTSAGCAGASNGTATVSISSGGSAPFSFAWNDAQQQTGQTATGLTTGTYTVTVTDALGCKATASVTVLADPTFITSATSTPVDCAGLAFGTASVQVSGGAAPFQVLWNDLQQQMTPTATDLTAGTYTVTVTDALGCSSVASTLVGTVGSSLDLSTSATQAGCAGILGTATVTVTAGGLPPFGYLWNDTQQQKTPTATALVPGNYQVTVTDELGCTATASATVAQANAITILVSADNASCHNTPDGSAAVAQVSNNATPPLSYLWSNGETTVGIDSLLPGDYAVIVTDAQGCTGSVPVPVNAEAIVGANFEWETTGCPPDTVTVQFQQMTSFFPPSNPIVTYQWIFNDGAQTSDEPNPSISTIDSVLKTTLIAANTSGCRDTITHIIEFDNLIEVEIPDTAAGCLGDELTIIVSYNPDDSLTFSWSGNGIVIMGIDQPNPTVSSSSSGVFTVNVTVSNPKGCTVQDSVIVTFSSDSISFDPALVVYSQCKDLTLDFTNNNPTAGIYTWFFNFPNDPSATSSETDPSFTYPDTGVYTVALVPKLDCGADTFYLDVHVAPPPQAAFEVEKSGCSDKVSVQFKDASKVPGNITSWSWEFSNGATSSLPDPVLVFNQNQIVVATLTIEFETNCTASVTDTVQVRIFDPDFLKDTVIACLPNPMASLNPDGDSTLSYQWAPPAGLSNANDWNPTATVSQTTIYTVTITDASGAEVCTVEKQVTVFVPPAIGLAMPLNVEACVATPDTLTATVSGQASLHWSSQADFSDTLSMDASVIVQVGTPPSTYYVMATDAFGCQEMGEVTVGVYPIQAQPPVFPDVCIGETPEVTISGIAPDETLSWQPFDPNTQPLNDTASFVLTITNSRGCTLTDTVILNSLDISNLIEVVPAADTILLGESVDLSVVAGFGHSCSWSPGAGLSNTSDCSPLATPQETTTYTVEVEDITTGCRGTGESVICVVSNLCAEPMIFVPNAFTPDGDGLNDVLYVRGYNIERVIIFAIYNRWGEKVFEAHSQSEGWDGTFNGKTAVGDVFAYYLKVECLSGEEFFKKGNVTVLR